MKKRYIQPNIKLFALRQRCSLLNGSIDPPDPYGDFSVRFDVQNTDNDSYHVGGGVFGTEGDDGDYGTGSGEIIW